MELPLLSILSNVILPFDQARLSIESTDHSITGTHDKQVAHDRGSGEDSASGVELPKKFGIGRAQDRREYLPVFEDWRVAPDWLPDTLYMNRYEDASFIPLASYHEDADLTTTTASGGSIAGENLAVWSEGRIPWRSDDRGTTGCSWVGIARRTRPRQLTLWRCLRGAAAIWHLTQTSTLELSVAPMDEEVDLPGKKKEDAKEKKKKEEEKKIKDKEKKKERKSPDFTIELVDDDACATVTSPVSRFVSIPPPFKAKFTKLAVIDDEGYNQDWEVVFQTVRALLSAFQPAGNSKVFDPSMLRIVRLKLDRTPMYKICISSIGFGRQ